MYINIEEEKICREVLGCSSVLSYIQSPKNILGERVEEKLNTLRKAKNIISYIRTVLTAPDFPKHR